MEKWGSMVKLYEERSTTKLPDDLKITIIQNMCPDNLRMHLELNSARLKNSTQVKTEIRAHLEARQPTPMDVDSWETYTPTYEDHDVHAFNTKGKGKGKGKGCHNCGGPHFARECPGA